MAAKERLDTATQKIEQERRTLEQLKHEIESKKKMAEETERKKDSALQSIQDLDDRLMLSRSERQQIARQLKLKDREIEEINAKVVMLRKEIGERRQSVLTRVRIQYMEGRQAHLRALLAANYEDLQQHFHYLSALSKREYDLIQTFETDLKQLQDAERQRMTVRDEMLVFKKHTDQKLGEIQTLKREKKQVLVRLNQEKESYDKAVIELERSAARVDSLLKELEQRRKVTAAIRPKKDAVVGHAAKGALQWPAEGDVVSFFGRQKHPTFATYVQRKGIEIRTEEASPIHAVMKGTVEYADWLKGYGQVLILDHGNGFFSLYAHASKLLAKVGEQVQAGQIIGETGDTGLTGDSTLYFELREGAEAVDPLVWLAKRR
jgi:septal ring factor EnvC (AmiA/AmiB activator)